MPTLAGMADEHQLDMRKFLAESEKRIEALRKLGPDVLPPNLVYPPLPDYDPKGECRCIKAWWDLSETGLLLYMDWGPDLPLNVDVEFRILCLRSAPYSSYVAPEAELDAIVKESETDNTPGGKKTLRLDEAEDHITGWVSCDGSVTLNYPNKFYPIGRDDNGNPSLELNWHNVEGFADELQKIVRRVTYEANAGNPQISEEDFGIGVDFEKVSPYTPPARQSKESPKEKDPSKSSSDLGGCGCLVLGGILAVAAYFIFFA